MKLYARLLLTFPFVVVAFCHYKIFNPDESCVGGFFDQIIIIVGFFLLALTGILAAIATLRKKYSDKPTPEPISLSISLVTMLFLMYGSTFRGHTKGDEWIYAENENSNKISFSQKLTLRKNGNFTIDLMSPELDCSFSGMYKKNGDTLILDKETIDKTDKEMTTVYLLKPNKLIPLFDTANKITFTITDIK